VAEFDDELESADEMENGAVQRRPGGRSARNREAVMRATMETLAELGFEGLTFTEIGRRAGVHGTSVQRRWGSRERVLLEALVSYANEVITIPDTGSLRTDMVGFSRSLSDYFYSPFGTGILKVLIADTGHDKGFAASRAEFVRMRMEAIAAIFQRARDRGEIRQDVSDETGLSMMLGPIYFRLLITRQYIDDEAIERTIDTLMRAWAA